MSVDEITSDSKSKMEKAITVLQGELKGYRTGRASTALVDNIRVDYYGTPTPLKQLAALATPQADSIMIKPFDAGALQAIEKAIKSSDLSIAPIIEGKFIRLNIPPLSEERRQQLVHQAKQTGENAKISVRNVRRDANKHLEKEEKDSIITEDDLKAGKKKIDDLTKEYVEQVDRLVKHKSDEILLD
ncbi:MAG: ribosome recycling factor [Phycisphaerae bacterium]|nr:ribosome recycling factor [Phycisphaerae bacterium]